VDFSKKETDQQILARLKEPIDKLVEKYCSEKTDYQRLRLRQLAWQTVDVLVRTGNIADIKHDKNVKRVIRNIKEVGASRKFIEKSLSLALTIYKRMKAFHPGILKRYGG
jgi:hypothetical protein